MTKESAKESAKESEVTTQNPANGLSDPPAFYAALVAAHEGLSEHDSAALNARLVLLLANHIGDQTVLQSLIEQAQR
jgi:hypothetical protein